ncbi:DUF7716 domain-containing protein [Chitinolyticbacter meiyuanensis]|uniref:DUF7716 domain-containing protein n=1 Tax=Chitinolyticbacter meiyuanensis TaxID=682798 RepID=UPI0011E5A794|nr:hypothetical protein [Chitinolyticbacter meiyuanensis]
MTLREILFTAEGLGEYDVVYAQRPWSLDSPARVVQYQPDETVLRQSEDGSLEYFLEATLIKDIREQVQEGGGVPSEAFRVIMYYAENDAFPE